MEFGVDYVRDEATRNAISVRISEDLPAQFVEHVQADPQAHPSFTRRGDSSEDRMNGTTDPTTWFDQFPPLADGVAWPTDSQWCARHWAPCVALKANGIGASIEIMKIWVSELKPAGVAGDDTKAMNRALAADSPICCKLGDERMYTLWGNCPPTSGSQPAGDAPAD